MAVALVTGALVSACGGPPATEADRGALIGVWAPTGKYDVGVTFLEVSHVVVYANGDFHYYAKPGYIVGRTWDLRSKTTLVLTSGNQVAVTCTIELTPTTLKIHNGSGRSCAAHEGDPMTTMGTDFFKAVAATPLPHP